MGYTPISLASFSDSTVGGAESSHVSQWATFRSHLPVSQIVPYVEQRVIMYLGGLYGHFFDRCLWKYHM